MIWKGDFSIYMCVTHCTYRNVVCASNFACPLSRSLTIRSIQLVTIFKSCVSVLFKSFSNSTIQINSSSLLCGIIFLCVMSCRDDVSATCTSLDTAVVGTSCINHFHTRSVQHCKPNSGLNMEQLSYVMVCTFSTPEIRTPH